MIDVDLEKLERSVRHELTADSLWLLNRIPNPKGQFAMLEIKPDKFTLLKGLEEFKGKPKATARFTQEWELKHGEIAKSIHENLSKLGFSAKLKGYMIRIDRFNYNVVNLSERCPFCKTPLQSVSGGKMLYQSGFTVYCPNYKDCQNQEVEAHGTSIANAVAFLKHKFASKYQEPKEDSMSKEGNAMAKAAEKRVAKQKNETGYTAEPEETTEEGATEEVETDETPETEETAEETKSKQKKTTKAESEKSATPKPAKKSGDEAFGVKLPKNKFDRFVILTMLEGGNKAAQAKKIGAKYPPEGETDGKAYFLETYKDYVAMLEQLKSDAEK